jgi:hypothetical protein
VEYYREKAEYLRIRRKRKCRARQNLQDRPRSFQMKRFQMRVRSRRHTNNHKTSVAPDIMWHSDLNLTRDANMPTFIQQRKMRGSEGFQELWSVDLPLDLLWVRRRIARFVLNNKGRLASCWIWIRAICMGIDSLLKMSWSLCFILVPCCFFLDLRPYFS